jgi:hypothetical protein
VCAVLLTVLACGCGSNDGQPAPPQATAEPASPARTSDAIGRDALARCAGFGAAHAADLLGVPASALVDKSQDISPNSRGCGFANSDGSSALMFSLNFDESVDDAKTAFAQMRDTLAIGRRVQDSATGNKSEEGAYSDILGLGDEAVWSSVNYSLAVRHKNITVLVMSPNDKKLQVAIAQKVVQGLQ